MITMYPDNSILFPRTWILIPIIHISSADSASATPILAADQQPLQPAEAASAPPAPLLHEAAEHRLDGKAAAQIHRRDS